MDYLMQAKAFLHRAKDTNDAEERKAHLNMAEEILAKALEELDQSRSTSGGSGLSREEEDVLVLLQDGGSRPGQPVPAHSLLLAWGTRGSEDELLATVKKLELKGLLTTDAAETGYELTEVGCLRP